MTTTWTSHWLPFRQSHTVYSRFDYSMLPPVDSREFERYKTVDDVKRDPPPMGPNPLFYEWCFDLPGMFMHDISFDIQWSLDKYGRVVIPGTIVHYTVANSLAEFLARMTIENGIWWSVVDNGLEELARDNETDPQHIWDILQPVLSEKQLAYLRPYYEIGTRRAGRQHI